MMSSLYKYIASRKPAILFSILILCSFFLGGFLFDQQATAAPLHLPKTIANDIDACAAKRGTFFGLEPWYHFMPSSEVGVPKHGDTPADPCGIKCFNIFFLDKNNPNDCGETASDVPGVILVVIDDLLRIAGLVAVAFIIIGSFEYVGSRGNPERTASAQSTIMNALVGLAVALIAVALVSFLGSRLG